MDGWVGGIFTSTISSVDGSYRVEKQAHFGSQGRLFSYINFLLTYLLFIFYLLIFYFVFFFLIIILIMIIMC